MLLLLLVGWVGVVREELEDGGHVALGGLGEGGSDGVGLELERVSFCGLLGKAPLLGAGEAHCLDGWR